MHISGLALLYTMQHFLYTMTLSASAVLVHQFKKKNTGKECDCLIILQV